jgi:hypothetical protein
MMQVKLLLEGYIQDAIPLLAPYLRQELDNGKRMKGIGFSPADFFTFSLSLRILGQTRVRSIFVHFILSRGLIFRNFGDF